MHTPNLKKVPGIPREFFGIFRFLRKKNRTIPWVRLGTWTLVYGMIFMTFYAAQGEERRLLAPAEFIFMALSARMAYDFLSLFHQKQKVAVASEY